MNLEKRMQTLEELKTTVILEPAKPHEVSREDKGR